MSKGNKRKRKAPQKKAASPLNLLGGLWLLLAALVVLAAGLAWQPVAPGGEAALAAMAREMGGGLTPLPSLEGIVRVHQPAAPVWLANLGLRFFGNGELGLRFFPALSGLGSVWLVYLLGHALWGRREAFLAGLMFVSSLGFMFFARRATPEPLAVFAVCLALWGQGALSRDRDWGGWVFWLGAALCVASVGSLGLVLCLGPLVLWAPLAGHWQMFTRVLRWQGLLLFLFLVSGPLIWGGLASPAYISEYFSLSAMRDALLGPGAHGGRFFILPFWALLGFSPWVFLGLFWALGGRASGGFGGGPMESWNLLAAWLLVSLLLLLLCGASLARHGFYLLPALALVLARPLALWREKTDPKTGPAAMVWLAGAMVAAAGVLLLAPGWSSRIWGVGSTFLALAPAIALLAAGVVYHLRRRTWALPWLPLGLAGVLGLALAFASLTSGPGAEAKSLGLALKRHLPARTVVASLTPERLSLSFYSRRPVYWLGRDADRGRGLLSTLFRRGGKLVLAVERAEAGPLSDWAFQKHGLRLFPWHHGGDSLALLGNFPPPLSWGN